MVQRQHGDAVGGPYVAVHLRRRDFLRARSEKVPTLETAAQQIRSALERYNLTSVFVATDAPTEGSCHILRLLCLLEICFYRT